MIGDRQEEFKKNKKKGKRENDQNRASAIKRAWRKHR